MINKGNCYADRKQVRVLKIALNCACYSGSGFIRGFCANDNYLLKKPVFKKDLNEFET